MKKTAIGVGIGFVIWRYLGGFITLGVVILVIIVWWDPFPSKGNPDKAIRESKALLAELSSTNARSSNQDDLDKRVADWLNDGGLSKAKGYTQDSVIMRCQNGDSTSCRVAWNDWWEGRGWLED